MSESAADKKAKDIPFLGSVEYPTISLKAISEHLNRGRNPDYAEEETDLWIINQACIQGDEIDYSEIKYHSKNPENESKGSIQKGDILINSTGSGTAGRASLYQGVDETDTIFADSHVTILRIDESIAIPEFVYYFFQLDSTRDYLENVEAVGATKQIEINKRNLSNLTIPNPPLQKQREIVRFLEHHIPNIGKLIDKKRSLLDRLGEKRECLITQLTTSGIDEQITKESGIPTIGKIPAHWEVVPNRAVFKEIDNRSVDGSEELLSVSHKTGVTPRSEKDVNMFEAESLEDYKIADKGDFVINTMWAWMGAVGISPQTGIVSPSYHVYRPTGRMIPEFADYFYRTPPYVAEMGRFSQGVWKSRQRLYPDDFLRMDTIVPPKSEQREIVNALREESKDIDSLRTKVESSISFLDEKRQSLINKAITGQIDLSNWQPSNEQEISQ